MGQGLLKHRFLLLAKLSCTKIRGLVFCRWCWGRKPFRTFALADAFANEAETQELPVENWRP
eukprot:6468465-Amphidinium_carterae.1